MKKILIVFLLTYSNIGIAITSLELIKIADAKKSGILDNKLTECLENNAELKNVSKINKESIKKHVDHLVNRINELSPVNPSTNTRNPLDQEKLNVLQAQTETLKPKWMLSPITPLLECLAK